MQNKLHINTLQPNCLQKVSASAYITVYKLINKYNKRKPERLKFFSFLPVTLSPIFFQLLLLDTG